MTLLLLGGTGDAKRIACELAKRNINAVVSLAGATRSPDPLPLPTRVGGFGGAEGFRDYLEEASITAVLDATHPFAHRITDRTARICAEKGLAHAIFVRPPWIEGEGDQWIHLDREQDAAQHIKRGQTVFLGTGRQTLHRFSNLLGCRVICRQIDPPTKPFPFEGGEYLIGRPPFSVEQETALFRDLDVDWLIVKNAGGQQSETKLIAARQLSIPVLMIKRPSLPEAIHLSFVDAAVDWASA